MNGVDGGRGGGICFPLHPFLCLHRLGGGRNDGRVTLHRLWNWSRWGWWLGGVPVKESEVAEGPPLS